MGDSTVREKIAKCPDAFRFHNQFKSNKVKNPKQCFKTYLQRAKRFKPNSKRDDASQEEAESSCETPKRKRESTRSRSASEEILGNKKSRELTKCSICQKHQAGSWPNQTAQLYRVSEMKMGSTRASKFLSAMAFNEDHFHNQYIYCQSVGDVFAADIYYHNACMSSYILCYERQVERIVKNFRRESEEEIHDDGLKEIFEKLDFHTQAYRLTDITERINNDLDLNFNNRATKFNIMIKFFGKDISFSHPKDRSVSQIVFKPSVPVSEIIEHNLRDRDVVTDCAKILLDEISSYKFGQSLLAQ